MCFLNSSALFDGKIAFRPIQMLSIFTVSNESFCSPPARKSMYILNSGMLLAISCPSQLRILPRLGFTSTLSRFSLDATSVQYSFSAVII